jgi:hypothetical protein
MMSFALSKEIAQILWLKMPCQFAVALVKMVDFSVSGRSSIQLAVVVRGQPSGVH